MWLVRLVFRTPFPCRPGAAKWCLPTQPSLLDRVAFVWPTAMDSTHLPRSILPETLKPGLLASLPLSGRNKEKSNSPCLRRIGNLIRKAGTIQCPLPASAAAWGSPGFVLVVTENLRLVEYICQSDDQCGDLLGKSPLLSPQSFARL